MSIIDSRELDMMKTFLDLSLQRHGTVSSNIANIDTPGFKAKKVNFEDELQAAFGGGSDQLPLSRTDERHLPIGENVAASVEISSDPGRPDGNNVDLEEEMVALPKNNIQFNLGVQLTSKFFKRIREAISSSRS